jgi:hypothetical protein
MDRNATPPSAGEAGSAGRRPEGGSRRIAQQGRRGRWLGNAPQHQSLSAQISGLTPSREYASGERIEKDTTVVGAELVRDAFAAEGFIVLSAVGPEVLDPPHLSSASAAEGCSAGKKPQDRRSPTGSVQVRMQKSCSPPLTANALEDITGPISHSNPSGGF